MKAVFTARETEAIFSMILWLGNISQPVYTWKQAGCFCSPVGGAGGELAGGAFCGFLTFLKIMTIAVWPTLGMLACPSMSKQPGQALNQSPHFSWAHLHGALWRLSSERDVVHTADTSKQPAASRMHWIPRAPHPWEAYSVPAAAGRLGTGHSQLLLVTEKQSCMFPTLLWQLYLLL